MSYIVSTVDQENLNEMCYQRKKKAALSLVSKSKKFLNNPIVDLNLLAVEILDKLSLSNYSKWIKTFNNTLEILLIHINDNYRIENLMRIVKENIIKRQADLNNDGNFNWLETIYNEIAAYFLNNVHNLVYSEINPYKFGFFLLNKISKNLYIKHCNTYLRCEPFGIDQLSIDEYNLTETMYNRKINSFIDDTDIRNIIFTYVVKHYLRIRDLDLQNKYISTKFLGDLIDDMNYDSSDSEYDNSDISYSNYKSESSISNTISSSHNNSASSSSHDNSASLTSDDNTDVLNDLKKTFVIYMKDGALSIRIKKPDDEKLDDVKSDDKKSENKISNNKSKRKRKIRDNFQCELCDHKPYSSSSGLKYHMKNKHNMVTVKRRKKTKQ